MEMPRIELGASYMLSMRSTTELHPLRVLYNCKISRVFLGDRAKRLQQDTCKRLPSVRPNRDLNPGPSD